MTQKDAITPAEYKAFQQAYDFLNRELFDGTLPQVLVTLQRHANTRGYFSAERFTSRIAERASAMTAAITTHELAMNPDTFNGRTDEEILSTLAHEMAHVWQQSFGKPGRGRYHNQEWATKMKEIGLHPSTTAAPGGKETGERVSHYIVPGGRYAQAYAKLKAKDFQLNWESVNPGTDRTKTASKTKFTCPECGQNAWAKPDGFLICGVCYEDNEAIVVMLAETGG